MCCYLRFASHRFDIFHSVRILHGQRHHKRFDNLAANSLSPPSPLNSAVGHNNLDQSACVTLRQTPLLREQCRLQVHRAFDYLSKSGEVDQPDVRYEVKVKRADSSVSQRGIYLREPLETAQPSSHIADVSPQLREVSHRSILIQNFLSLCNNHTINH